MAGRQPFPIRTPNIYLDTAAEGIPAPGVREAVAEYLREKERGTPGRDRHFSVELEARNSAASLLDVAVENVAFLPSASDAINILAASLPWKAGDRIITTDLEFPSNLLPWFALRDRGVEVCVVPSRDGALYLEDLLSALDNRTKLVTISQVNYKTGAWFPHTTELARAVHASGGVLCVDATQALGRCPVPVAGVDYLMASTFKWLLGLHGSAVTYMSPRLRDRFSLAGVGWYSVQNSFTAVHSKTYELKPGASCLVAGMPNFGAIYAIDAALKFFQSLDLPNEQERANALAGDLRRHLAGLGLPLLTPASEEFTSGIVSFESTDGESMMKQLAARGITVWGGDGRVRASIHYYNSSSDIDRLVNALSEIVSK